MVALYLSLIFCALLCVLSSFEEEERADALLLLSYGCLVTVNVMRLFLTVPRADLWCVIVVFLDHTHLLLLTMT